MQDSKCREPNNTKNSFQNIISPFVFIRHGETDWNRKSIVAGCTDVPLNEYGISQAEKAGKILKESATNITTIISSPLQRALKTAKIIQKKISGEIIVIDDLKEMNFGVMEGAPVGDKKWIIEWSKGKSFEGAETSNQFSKGVIKALEQVLNRYQSPILIVSHGGVWIQILKHFSVPLHDIPNSVPYYVDLTLDKNRSFFKPVQ